MPLAALVISLFAIVLIAACAISYRIGRTDGFADGFREGSPKSGEIPALRFQVKRLQQALETQTACQKQEPDYV